MHRVPEPISSIEIGVYSKKSLRFDVNGWESLAPYRNGFRSGARIFEKNVPTDITPSRLGSTKQLFLMLKAGRLDNILVWKPTGDRLINKLGLTGISSQEKPLVTLNFYIYLHTKHLHLIDEMDSAIRASKADGSYQRIWEETIGLESVN